MWPLIKKLAWGRSTFTYRCSQTKQPDNKNYGLNKGTVSIMTWLHHRDIVFLPATVSMVPDRGVASHGEECQVG